MLESWWHHGLRELLWWEHWGRIWVPALHHHLGWHRREHQWVGWSHLGESIVRRKHSPVFLLLLSVHLQEGVVSWLLFLVASSVIVSLDLALALLGLFLLGEVDFILKVFWEISVDISFVLDILVVIRSLRAIHA